MIALLLITPVPWESSADAPQGDSERWWAIVSLTVDQTDQSEGAGHCELTRNNN
jgi:hypothetical protein